MKKLGIVALVVGLIGLTAGSQAATAADDATGTWKWTTERKGQKTETTLKLKVEGDKLTGTVSSSFGGKAQETKISDGTFKNGEISFNVVREFKDQKFVTKYSGKVSGDTIKGTIESSFGGKDQKRDWEAKRAVVKD